MATTMHRLQISLPARQYDYLRARAERESASLAEIIRQLLEREEAANNFSEDDVNAALSFAGTVTDEKPLKDNVPVSENIDLYLLDALQPQHILHEPRPARYRTKKARK
jgi:hypothetical protein